MQGNSIIKHMSERELVRELKETIKDLSKDRDIAESSLKQKESRIKQVLIKLEHATSDVQSLGHKIGQQNKEISNLQIKLETKERLLNEALEKIREFKNESTEDDTQDQPDVEQEQQDQEQQEQE